MLTLVRKAKISPYQVRNITPFLRSLSHQRVLIGPGVYVPMVVVIEVPIIWEIPPRGGRVVVALGAVCLLVFVGLGLVFQDLWDNAAVQLGGDEHLWEDQWARWSSLLFAFIL